MTTQKSSYDQTIVRLSILLFIVMALGVGAVVWFDAEPSRVETNSRVINRTPSGAPLGGPPEVQPVNPAPTAASGQR